MVDGQEAETEVQAHFDWSDYWLKMLIQHYDGAQPLSVILQYATSPANAKKRMFRYRDYLVDVSILAQRFGGVWCLQGEMWSWFAEEALVRKIVSGRAEATAGREEH